MRFKSFLWKKVMPYYFMIVTFINIGQFLSGWLIYSHEQFNYTSFAAPPVMGAIGCVPFLLDYAFQRKICSGTAIGVLCAVEWAVLEICIFAAAWLLDIIDTPLSALIIFLMTAAIFAAVSGVMYLQDRQLCLQMNDALESYKKRTNAPAIH